MSIVARNMCCECGYTDGVGVRLVHRQAHTLCWNLPAVGKSLPVTAFLSEASWRAIARCVSLTI